RGGCVDLMTMCRFLCVSDNGERPREDSGPGPSRPGGTKTGFYQKRVRLQVWTGGNAAPDIAGRGSRIEQLGNRIDSFLGRNSMFSLALLAASAFLLTLAFTPVCRTVCTRLGWVDRPGPRKVHRDPVPRTGGIAILWGYAAAFLVLFYSPFGAGRAVAGTLPGVW